MRHHSFRIFNGQTREERQPAGLGSCSGDVSCRPANLTGFLCLLLLLLLTAIELSPGGSSPYTGTDKTNKNKYT